jgi:hypothetical protein
MHPAVARTAVHPPRLPAVDIGIGHGNHRSTAGNALGRIHNGRRTALGKPYVGCRAAVRLGRNIAAVPDVADTPVAGMP